MCKRELPADKNHFSTQSAKKDGLCPMCKECRGRNFTTLKPIAKEGFKICSECGDELLATNFGPRKDSKDGLKGICRVCTAKSDQEYFRDNKEAIMAINLIYRAGHKDEKSNYSKQFYRENKDPIIKRSKLYRENNKPSVYAAQKKYRSEHKESSAEYSRVYRIDNKEHLADMGKISYQKNKVVRKVQATKYRECHREEIKTYGQRHRTLKKNLPSTLTAKQWAYIRKHFNNSCCYCGKEKPLEQEHMVPLVKGGEFSRDNILPACRSCNASKHTQDFFTWYPRQPFYSKQREQKILTHLNYDKNHQQQLSLI